MKIQPSLMSAVLAATLCGPVAVALRERTGAATAASNLTAADLRVEYASNPLGVDVAVPRLFWKVESSTRGQRQITYRILAASTAETLARDHGDLWDSGRIVSEETTHVPYRGSPLKSSQRVHWKVRVWNQDGDPSAWSVPASWTMGLLSEGEWTARWISAPADPQTLLLRREFSVRPGLTHAVAHLAGLGQYAASVNGEAIGDDLLSPGWTKYDKTVLYDTRDLTASIHEGRNAVGLALAGGMYSVRGGRYTKFKGSFGALKAIAQIHLEYADGTKEVVGTDERWRTSPGPIAFSCVYGGEDYDARLEQHGWNEPGFDDSTWQDAVVVEGPGGVLRGLTHAAPPLKTFDVLKPIGTRSLGERVTVYDLGQNAALMPRLVVGGAAGAAVKITPAELVNDDGSADRRSVGGGEAYWKYTLAGRGRETWFPQFFYHGARYLQVERSPADGGTELPVVEGLEGVVVHSSSPPVGEFETSSDLFNRIHRLVRWAQRSNLASVITDCPHRERLGWLEQYHLNGPSLRYEFDLARMFTKGMSDMADSQLASGLVPDIAPEYTVFEDGFRDSPEWGSAHVIVPWQQYEWTGDVELLRRYYDSMKRYIAYLGSRARNHIVSHGLGDWYDIGPERPGYAQLTPIPLTATAFYYYDAWILSRAAALLGKPDDAKQYEELAGAIRAAFNEKFFARDARQYATGSQAANAIPVVLDLVEPDARRPLVDAIVRDVRHRGNAMTAGDVGYRYLLRALARAGRSDVVFDMNNQSEKPGYGYQLKMGATSLTEAWNADRRSSQNHFMLGQIVEWFYHDLAGIGVDPAGPGFKKVIINPQPVGDLTWVRASYESIRGRIVCHWTRVDGTFELSVTIPANTSATLFVPARSADRVTVDGVPAVRQAGVKFLRQEGDRAVFEVVSGKWVFQSRL